MKSTLKAVAIAFLLTALAHGQTSSAVNQRVDKPGLSFDVPAEWNVVDNSNDTTQSITVSPQDGSVLIAVVSQRATPQQCDFQAASKGITDALVDRTAKQIQAATERPPIKTQIGGDEVEGVQIRGHFNSVAVISEIYSLRVGLRFINLLYTHADGDAKAHSAWETVRNTLRVFPPVFTAEALTANKAPNANILNGKALRLGQPAYPALAKRDRVSGTIIVQVVIDGTGKVVSAVAVEGHLLLRGSAVAAARASTFAPTKVCGEAVMVSGVITYTFGMN